jgi:DNA/RNA-binding domain of Phe-tRNA-synthetase-like protein
MSKSSKLRRNTKKKLAVIEAVANWEQIQLVRAIEKMVAERLK